MTRITVDMSDFDRPSAQGTIIDSSTITVTFPDDHAYTGTLESPRIFGGPMVHRGPRRVRELASA